MDAIKIYSDMIKKRIDEPKKFRKMLKTGYNLEYLRSSHITLSDF